MILMEICFRSQYLRTTRGFVTRSSIISSRPAIDMVATRDCARTMTELITFFRRGSCYTLHVFQAIWNTETLDTCYSCFAQSRLDTFPALFDLARLANVIMVVFGKIRMRNISYPNCLDMLKHFR